MTKTKTTKRALFASVLSLLVCFSMLVGSTFAWFSDSASTSVNKIQAGELKIDLVKADGTSVKGQTIDFEKAEGHESEAILWEPGCTYNLPELYIKNMGNLAFKYKVVITGINGNAKLNEAIEWTIDYGYAEGADEGYMLGDATLSAPIKISGHMKEDAGNEYQGLSIDGIAITVIATQHTAEFDSFTDQYDKDADGTPDHPYVNVNNSTELKEALANAAAGDVIVLNSGNYVITEAVKTNGSVIVPEGASVTLNMSNNALASNVSASVNAPTVVNNGDLTIENATITNNNATAGNTDVAAVHNVEGTLTLKNCTIENVAPTTQGDYAVVVEGGKVIMENCTVKGNRGAIAVSGDGSVEMIGGSVSANVYYPLYIGGTGASTFENVTFTKLNNSKGKAITYNVFNENAGTALFTGCTFTTERSAEIPFDINGKTTGFTFSNCTFTKVTAVAQFEDVANGAEANTEIVLNSGTYEITEEIGNKSSFVIPEGADVTIKLNNNSITTNASSDVNVPTIVNNGNLTIEGGTISNKNATAGNTNVAAVYNESGTLTLKDCIIENIAPTSGGDYAVVVEGGEVILDNCAVTGNRGGIAVTGGTLKMTGGSVSANVYYPVYLVGDAKAEFNNVSFTKQNNSKGQAVIYNALTNGTATFTGCTFESKIASETKLEINNTLTGLTFNGCTYTNVKQPNA